MAARSRPWLRALGDLPLPARYPLGGRSLRLLHPFKHDFYAATGLYQDERGRRFVVKLGRRAPLLGLPMGWLGRLLTRNEARALVRLAGLPGVPALVSRPEPHVLVRAYVEGTPLGRGLELPDDFFARLGTTLDALHARGWAYVDLEKPENVIVGLDGAPWLCDFQISWSWPARLGGRSWPLRLWLSAFQCSDRYHLLKLERRLRPEGMSPADLARARRRPLPVRFHRALARPFQRVRRALLARLEGPRGPGERGDLRPPRLVGEERSRARRASG